MRVNIQYYDNNSTWRDLPHDEAVEFDAAHCWMKPSSKSEVTLTLGRTTYVPGDTVRGTVQLTVGKEAVRVEAVRHFRTLDAFASTRVRASSARVMPIAPLLSRADAAAAARPPAHRAALAPVACTAARRVQSETATERANG